MSGPRYRRILLKLSGEAFAGGNCGKGEVGKAACTGAKHVPTADGMGELMAAHGVSLQELKPA